MGKWIDDPVDAEIWKNRENNPKPYIKEYSGKKMQSVALPRSAKIQSVLKLLNDQFCIPTLSITIDTCLLHPFSTAKSIRVEHFDPQETIEAHVLAFLHLVGMIHDSVREMLTNLVGTIPRSIELTCLIEKSFGHRVSEIAKADAVSKRLLHDLGCWPDTNGRKPSP